MKLAYSAIILASITLMGCADDRGNPGTMPGGRSTDTPIVNSPQAPAIDQNMNPRNNTSSDVNHGSSSPAGGNPQNNGH